MHDVTTPDDRQPYAVPPHNESVACHYCERPFPTERQRNLHLGEVHAAAIDDEERAAYEDAVDAEHDELWLYHFKAVVVLLAVYMLTGLAYLIVLSA